MNRSLYGEYDGYDYRPVEEMTLQEQIESAKKALVAAKKLSQTRKSDSLDQKIVEIKHRIQQLESMEEEKIYG
jgi:hypothetical protein